MTLKELRDNVLRVLWMEQQATVPDYIWEDVTTAINSALQLMFSSPLDYFRKEEYEVTFAAGETEKDLYSEDNIQEVVGPLWIAAEENRELHRITDESEFNQFFQRFFGMSEADAVTAGTPAPSYYLVRTRRSYSENSGRDASQCILAIKPAPTATVLIKMLCAKSAPEYSTATVTAWGGSEVTPVPGHKMETTLLSLARWYAMRSHFFFEKDKIELINADAARAMQMLQVTDPEMGTKSHMVEQLAKQASQPRTEQ
jgi:hypothetical protein